MPTFEIFFMIFKVKTKREEREHVRIDDLEKLYLEMSRFVARQMSFLCIEFPIHEMHAVDHKALSN